MAEWEKKYPDNGALRKCPYGTGLRGVKMQPHSEPYPDDPYYDGFRELLERVEIDPDLRASL